MKYPWERLKKQGDWIQIDGRVAAGVSPAATRYVSRTYGPKAVVACNTIKTVEEEGGPACIVTLVYVPPPVVIKPEVKVEEPLAMSPATMRRIMGAGRLSEDDGGGHHLSSDDDDEIDPSLLEEPDDHDVEATRLPDGYQGTDK